METKAQRGDVFKCEGCDFEENYDYKGQKPEFCKSIEFNQVVYLMKNPFGRNEFLILGRECSKCTKRVCIDCSLYYLKAYCRSCACEHLSEFPKQLQTKISK